MFSLLPPESVATREELRLYLEALDSQRFLYAAELSLASAQGDEYRSLVQLYRALGGGGNSDLLRDDIQATIRGAKLLGADP